jgi:general secretion pathway protein D
VNPGKNHQPTMQKTPLYRTSRTAVLLMAVAAAMPAVVSVANAGEGDGLTGLAQREMIRRQQAIILGDNLLAEGRTAFGKGDYQQAVDKYTQALRVVPDAPLLADRRQSYTQHLTDASVALAQQFRKTGKYDEARVLLEGVLKPGVDPENFDAKRELDWLDDPIRTNPALTYEHTQKVDKVRKSLYMAEGQYNLGKYDDAKREYENVIRLDPYNTAAQRGLEKLAQARSDYYRAAYDHTRAEMLSQVDKTWEIAVPVDAPLQPTQTETSSNDRGVGYITAKLRSIIIPQITFEDATVEEAIDTLRLRALELDKTTTDPATKGVNFVIRRPVKAAAGAPDAGLDASATTTLGGVAEPGALRIKELRLRNVPLAVVLKYICDATKLRYKIDEFAVTLVPQTDSIEELFTRSFNVPPDFATTIGGGADASGGATTDPDPFTSGSDTGAGGPAKLSPRPSITKLLESAGGVKFTAGSSANLSTNGVLLVTNTPAELDKIEQLVELNKGKAPKQVKITTKFVEISQENSDELGFDWILSPFGLNANSLFLGGGTIGSGSGRTNADFQGSLNGTTIPGIPSATGQNVFNVITGGLRSGQSAINKNNVQALLNNPNRTAQSASVAPGIMALTGLFSDGQVQLIMRGLAQKKGTDLMTAPSVTARSGEKAKIEIIREFIYPTEYEPPQLPNSVGATGGGNSGFGGLSQSAGIFPVTPATPTSFETRNTGVTLEIVPTIGANDLVIDLSFVPEIVEFEGFINYGSPIQSPASDFLGNPTTVTITENRIEMPVFSSRRVNTALTIYDGYTVAVGGLMREDVQNVEDKVPILGDIPIIGRLFQSKAENRIKSNLIIFVTAQIIDATGRPLRGPDANSPAASNLGQIGADLGLPDSGAGVLPPMPTGN